MPDAPDCSALKLLLRSNVRFILSDSSVAAMKRWMLLAV